MSCESCKFSQGFPEKPTLECRLNPPLLISNGHGFVRAWPEVSPREWCGQEQARIPQPAEGRTGGTAQGFETLR
jgi:hypothetical protein